ncbi:MAG: aminotransferase class I/II-fold pyridoxal phosphate-dependent enzyme, partial [Cyanobacteria bacterium J083]
MNKSNSSADNTPLLKALRQLAHKLHSPFYAPGHKQGRGMNPKMKDLVEKLGVKADLPELPELDNLFAPTNLIKLAQDLAAETFGAEHTWFLVNGSTCGIIASILATCQPGDKIILPRNIHQSAIAGLILAGARPIFLQPAYDSDLDLVGSLTPQVIEQALQQHPESKAVLLLYPTYQGVGGEIATIAKLVHRYNIPILVDEAHGAHFSFHPNLPISALAAGADVAVQSTHKTLSSLTQASMLHLQGKLVSANKISQALQLLESTSPNYLLLASLDAAREQMAVSGQKLMSQTLELAAIARQELNKLEVISVLELPQPLTPGFASLDSTRLTLDVRKLGLSGFVVDDILHQKLGVTAELPLPQQLTFMITLGNTLDDIR